MKKRILFYFFIGGSDGGSDYSLFIHIKNLNLQKFEPVIIYKNNSNLVKELKSDGLTVISLKSENLKKSPKKNDITNIKKKNNKSFLRNIYSSTKLFYKALPEAFKLKKIIKKNKIDIIHLNHNLNGDRSGIIAGILTKIKIISHHRGLHQPILVDVLLSKFVNKIICISNFVKDEYIKSGINENNCITVYNGVNTDIFKPIQKNNNKIIIGCIGRLEKWKGQEVLIKAIPEIINLFPNVKFQFLGDGSYKEELVFLAQSLGINEYVEFFGSVNNIENYIKEFTIAVHTSVEPEPFGRVLIEAMAMGKVVIATNIGGPKEIINNSIDGFLIPPKNSHKLASTIIMLLKDKDLKKSIELNAREKVVKEFDAKITSSKIEKLYDSIIK